MKNKNRQKKLKQAFSAALIGTAALNAVFVPTAAAQETTQQENAALGTTDPSALRTSTAIPARYFTQNPAFEKVILGVNRGGVEAYYDAGRLNAGLLSIHEPTSTRGVALGANEPGDFTPHNYESNFVGVSAGVRLGDNLVAHGYGGIALDGDAVTGAQVIRHLSGKNRIVADVHHGDVTQGGVYYQHEFGGKSFDHIFETGLTVRAGEDLQLTTTYRVYRDFNVPENLGGGTIDTRLTGQVSLSSKVDVQTIVAATASRSIFTYDAGNGLKASFNADATVVLENGKPDFRPGISIRLKS